MKLTIYCTSALISSFYVISFVDLLCFAYRLLLCWIDWYCDLGDECLCFPLSIGTMDSLQLFVYVFKKAPEAYIYTSKLFVPLHFCTYKNYICIKSPLKFIDRLSCTALLLTNVTSLSGVVRRWGLCCCCHRTGREEIFSHRSASD